MESTTSIRPRRVHVIINPAAGQDQPVLSVVNRILNEYGVDWEAFVTKDRGDARRFASESAAAGVDAVLVSGGDGTVTEAANALRGTGVPLSILPGGTANTLSVTLGIPSDLERAAALAASGQNTVRVLDMGQVGNQEFILRVGVGMEARMILETPRETKTRFGNLAYLLNGLSQLTNPEVARYTLNLDGLHVEVEGITLFVANSANVGLSGIDLVQGVDLCDGLLDVILVRRSDLPSLIAIATNALLGRAEELEPVLHWQAREVSVYADPHQPVQVDGEAAPDTPFIARVIPQAIGIICPPPA